MTRRIVASISDYVTSVDTILYKLLLLALLLCFVFSVCHVDVMVSHQVTYIITIKEDTCYRYVDESYNVMYDYETVV